MGIILTQRKEICIVKETSDSLPSKDYFFKKCINWDFPFVINQIKHRQLSRDWMALESIFVREVNKLRRTSFEKQKTKTQTNELAIGLVLHECLRLSTSLYGL